MKNINSAPDVSEPGWLWRGFSRVVAIPAVSGLAMRIATVIDRPLLRLSAGRLRLSFVIPCLLLRCTGVRTGRQREVPLLYVPDGEDVLLVGSGGGSARDPAWCANLRGQPRVACIRAGRTEPRLAVELTDEARSEAWDLAVKVYPGYARYQARLDRQIPVFRLRRRA